MCVGPASYSMAGGGRLHRVARRPLSPGAPKAISVSLPSFQGDAQEFPYYLHLYMSSLLSDGRGASQTWLQGVPDPMTTIAWQTWVELNPSTAADLGVQDGDLVVVRPLRGD